MNRIDDNTLAAYLEGNLSDEERERVEQAIEEDDELKAVVDEWISMADEMYASTKQEIEDDRELRMEACRSIGAVMEQVKSESGYYKKAVGADFAVAPNQAEAPTKTSQLKQKWPIYRKILIAASVLAFVSVTGIWLFRSSSDGIQPIGTFRSAPSFDVPMGGDYMICEPQDTTDADTCLESFD